VKGSHAQKVHTGETVGPNHRSQFHSETRVSHSTSQPNNLSNNQSANHIGPQNSQPVKVIDHQWPGISFQPNMPQMMQSPLKFPNPVMYGNIQRFYQPEMMVPPPLNPGFQRFFESIGKFGPSPDPPTPIHEKPALAIEDRTPISPTVDFPRDDVSEASSIRSSASAYWPPELKFPHMTEETQNDWQFHKPQFKVMRKPVNAPILTRKQRMIL